MSAASLSVRARCAGRSGIVGTAIICMTVSCLSILVTASSSEARSRAQDAQQTGIGGLVLPDSEPPAARVDAAQCAGCRWRVTTPCTADPRAPVASCRVLQSGCGADVLRQLWWAESGRRWRQQGLVCLSPAGPMTLKRMRDRLATEAGRALPMPRPSCSPALGAVPDLPLRCSSGQPPRTHTVQITENQASITADLTPEWRWELSHARGARSGPEGRAAHVVALVPTETGRWTVTVRTVWRARVSISGVTLPTAGFQVEQRASTSVGVARARTILRPSTASSGWSGADVRGEEVPWQTTRTKARPSDIA